MSFFSKDPVKKTIYIVVPLAHILSFVTLGLSGPTKKTVDPKKLVVKTFTPQSSSPAVKTVAAKKNSTVSKTNTPKQNKKSVAAALTPQKAPEPKKEKTIPVKKQNSAKEKVLKELEERIAKIDTKNDRMALERDWAIPSKVTLSSQTALQDSDSFVNHDSSSEKEFLSSVVGYLQRQLQLPDLGEVQIQLTLDKDGKVETMKVIHAESEKNRKYLEENLPKLSFTLLFLDKTSSQSFVFTFCSKF